MVYCPFYLEILSTKLTEVGILQRCIICEEGKADGIHLYTSFICEQCEYNMIHTDAREEKYRYYINKLKNMNKQQLYTSL